MKKRLTSTIEEIPLTFLLNEEYAFAQLLTLVFRDMIDEGTIYRSFIIWYKFLTFEDRARILSNSTIHNFGSFENLMASIYEERME